MKVDEVNVQSQLLLTCSHLVESSKHVNIHGPHLFELWENAG